MTQLITPRTLKGFRDYVPAVMMPREAMMDVARRTFRSFGYAPIDTPMLEYTEILTGKGGDETDRQMFAFKTRGGKDVAMRFDLTVPLARFAAQHIGELGTPFRRYHIAPVFRGENPQAGRYREFVQCDFDLVGPTSAMADTEIVLVIDQLFRNLSLDRFTIALNNRAVLTGLLEHLGLVDRATAILRSLDKLTKIGRDKTAAEMVRVAEIDDTQADAVLRLADLHGSANDVLDALPEVTGGNPTAAAGIERLTEVYRGAIDAGVPEERLKIDVSLARGLDYYTGMIFETTLDDLPGIGSVCSGGRYDNLAGLYTKTALPGVGASLGLDRLIAALDELKKLPVAGTPAPVLVPQFEDVSPGRYLRLAAMLRDRGVGVEVYPETKKLKAQLKYANDRGHQAAIIAGPSEWEFGKLQIKDLTRRDTHTIDFDDDIEPVLETLRAIISTR